MRDQLSNQQIVRAATQTLAGTTPNNSALFDRRGFSSVTVYLQNETITDAGTAAGFTVKLQHSNSTLGSSFVDVEAGDLLPTSGSQTLTVTTDGANGIIAGGLGYNGNRRYVRAVATGTTGTNATISMIAVLGNPHRAPTVPVGATVAAT